MQRSGLLLLSCVHCHPQSACLERSFPEMVLCPEVLTLIVAAALLSRHGGTRRESEAGQRGRLMLTAGAQRRAGPPTAPLLPSDNWARISTFRSAWIQRKEPCVAENCIQTFCKYEQFLNFFFFLVKTRLHLGRNSKSHLGKLYVHLPCSANLLPALFVSAGRTMSLILYSLDLSDSRRNSQICYVKAMSSSLVFRMLLHASIKQGITMVVWGSSLLFSAWGSTYVFLIIRCTY